MAGRRAPVSVAVPSPTLAPQDSWHVPQPSTDTLSRGVSTPPCAPAPTCGHLTAAPRHSLATAAPACSSGCRDGCAMPGVPDAARATARPAQVLLSCLGWAERTILPRPQQAGTTGVRHQPGHTRSHPLWRAVVFEGHLRALPNALPAGWSRPGHRAQPGGVRPPGSRACCAPAGTVPTPPGAAGRLPPEPRPAPAALPTRAVLQCGRAARASGRVGSPAPPRGPAVRGRVLGAGRPPGGLWPYLTAHERLAKQARYRGLTPARCAA